MGIVALFQRLATGGRAAEGDAGDAALSKVLIVGSPNVGKSALFNRLTGRYVTVSNYPGTTVEVSRGRSRLLGDGFEVVDTPGMYSLLPITEEERVARALLLEDMPRAVVHVVDAKNLERMLGLTLQLAEAGLPLVLALNMADEAEDLGIRIDAARLQETIGVPVVRTVATRGDGLAELIEQIRQVRPVASKPEVDYGPTLEEAIAAVRRGASRSGREPCSCSRATASIAHASAALAATRPWRRSHASPPGPDRNSTTRFTTTWPRRSGCRLIACWPRPSRSRPSSGGA